MPELIFAQHDHLCVYRTEQAQLHQYEIKWRGEIDAFGGIQQIQAVQAGATNKLVVRDVYKVVVLVVQADLLVEMFTFRFEKTAVKFR